MTDDRAPGETPDPRVAEGGGSDLRIQGDKEAGWKVTPLRPTDGERPSQEQSRASEQDGPPAMPSPGALEEEDLPSAWQAIRPGVDPGEVGE